MLLKSADVLIRALKIEVQVSLTASLMIIVTPSPKYCTNITLLPSIAITTQGDSMSWIYNFLGNLFKSILKEKIRYVRHIRFRYFL